MQDTGRKCLSTKSSIISPLFYGRHHWKEVNFKAVLCLISRSPGWKLAWPTKASVFYDLGLRPSSLQIAPLIEFIYIYLLGQHGHLPVCLQLELSESAASNPWCLVRKFQGRYKLLNTRLHTYWASWSNEGATERRKSVSCERANHLKYFPPPKTSHPIYLTWSLI